MLPTRRLSHARTRLPTAPTPRLRACRDGVRPGVRRYARAYLKASVEEVATGLAGHFNCPAALREWMARERGGLGTTAAQMC